MDKANPQRLGWLVLAMVALSVPLWYEIALQPGNYVFAWRWTEQQGLVESIVSVLHVVLVIWGVFMLKRAVGDMPQWPLIRIGAWIWVGMVALFALFSVVMNQVGEHSVVESVEGDGYRINFVRIAGTQEEYTQMNAVLSCNHTMLYKNVLYLERLVGVDNVQVSMDGDNIMTVNYRSETTTVREEAYDIDDFYRRCRND